MGRLTRSAGVSIGTLSEATRSSLRLANSAKSLGSLVSVAEDAATRVVSRTSGSLRVMISAVFSLTTRRNTRELELPSICSALARLPIRASTSAQVWV